MSIAFDSITFGSIVNPGTSQTFAAANSNASIILVGIQNGGSNTNNITAVTYAGVALTKITSINAAALLGQQWDYWFLAGPATGTNNVVITGNVSAVINGGCVFYTGSSLTGQPDAGPTSNLQATGGTNTSTVVSVADNCWQIVTGGDSGNTNSAASGALRGNAPGGALYFYDSGGPIHPAGSNNVVINTSSALGPSLVIGITISPVPPTQILKVSGVAQASIAKVSSVAIGSIKKVSGVTNV